MSDVKKSASQYMKEYQAANLDEIRIRPVKGTKQRWRQAAALEGKSLQRFVIDLVDGYILKLPPLSLRSNNK